MKIPPSTVFKAMAPWALGLVLASRTLAATYYVHPAQGSDDNAGTNSAAPLKTLAQVNHLALHPGDQVLLAAGEKFAGQIAIENVHGTSNRPLLIATYSPQSAADAGHAWIDARGFVAGVCLKNCSEVTVKNLRITANGGGMQPGQIVKPDLRCGVLVVVDQPGEFSGFTFSNLVVQDIFYEEPGFVRGSAETRTANGTQKYGWGIECMNRKTNAILRNIFISNCAIENVSHTGLQFSSPSNCLRDVVVTGIRVTASGGPGVQMSGLCGGHFSRLDVNGSGSTNDTRNWKRGSGLWTWSCNDVLIEKSRFQNANGPGDSCGVHIDYHCRNVIVQKNFSAHNAGGFCEILGNDYNCAYRYNVSVNDGYRVKGRDGAFQEGKTFWLSGYTGDKNPRCGPFNTYFYNNTIFVNEDIIGKFAIAPTTQGLLIANNIFCLQGRSEMVAGDQSRQDLMAAAAIPNVVFTNNLYLKPGNWPAALVIQDQGPLTGDPQFTNPGGSQAQDYIPQNVHLIKHRGIPVPFIPGDSVGLVGGLKIERDILGHLIVGTPDLGAVETTYKSQAQLGLK